MDALRKAEKAVFLKNYTQAKNYARQVVKPSEKEKANIILSYLKYGDNMLYAALWQDDIKALEYLSKIVPDIEAIEERFNVSVLILAAAWGKADMVKILLESGADPNHSADADGHTALMWAAKNFDEQREMAEVLMESGAEVNVKSKYGDTPIEIAKTYRNPYIASLLKKESADLSVVTYWASAAEENGWLYYSNWDHNFKLYRSKTYGSSQEKIADYRCRHVRVSDGWIYYEDIDDEGRIYRVKTDGSSKYKVTDDRSWNLQIEGEWIYYQNIDDGESIYRIKTDGSNGEKLNGDRSWYVQVSDGWIYYTNFNNDDMEKNSVYRMKTDGSFVERIIEDTLEKVVIDGKWIYYLISDFGSKDNHSRIYRIKIDGSNIERIGDDWATNLRMSDGWLYYVTRSGGENIFRIKTDGSNRQIVNEDRTGQFDIVGEWIYYLNRDDGYKVYRIRKNGLGLQAVEG